MTAPKVTGSQSPEPVNVTLHGRDLAGVSQQFQRGVILDYLGGANGTTRSLEEGGRGPQSERRCHTAAFEDGDGATSHQRGRLQKLERGKEPTSPGASRRSRGPRSPRPVSRRPREPTWVAGAAGTRYTRNGGLHSDLRFANSAHPAGQCRPLGSPGHLAASWPCALGRAPDVRPPK